MIKREPHTELLRQIKDLFKVFGYRILNSDEQVVAGRKVDVIFESRLTLEKIVTFVETSRVTSPKWDSMRGTWERIQRNVHPECRLWVIAPSYVSAVQEDLEERINRTSLKRHSVILLTKEKLERNKSLLIQDINMVLPAAVKSTKINGKWKERSLRQVGQYARWHLKNSQPIQAVDCLLWKNEILKKLQKRGNRLRVIAKNLEIASQIIQSVPIDLDYYYFREFIRENISTQLASLRGERISNNRKFFREECERIMRSIRFLESHEKKGRESIYNSVYLGRSRFRSEIKFGIEHLLAELESSPNGSVHNGCSLCTSTSIIELALCHPDTLSQVQTSISWLLEQKDQGFAVIDGREASVQHATFALVALSLLNKRSKVVKLAMSTLDNFTSWNQLCERDPLLIRGNHLYEISHIFTRYGLRDWKGVVEKFHKAWLDFLSRFKRSDFYERTGALRGLLISPNLINHVKLKEVFNLADKTYSELSQDPLWDPITGGWGNDIVSTMYRTNTKLVYWEWYLRYRK